MVITTETSPACRRRRVQCQRHVMLAAILLLAATQRLPAQDGDKAAAPATGVSLTVYNQNFAVVKDHRRLTLPESGTVRFDNVAATIVPETVTFTPIDPVEATVLEQSYEFDLVNADKLLQSYIDREITIIDRAGTAITGTLLSSDAQQLVLAGTGGIDLIPRQNNIRDVRFSKLPEGLLTRPTLVWNVRAAQPGDHLVRVAYRAGNLTWRVDYRAVAAQDEKTVDLSGWVTVTNNCGTAFPDAQLKLMAGDVNVETQTKAVIRGGRARRKSEFTEKSFSDYHLYTLNQPVTLQNAQTKQVELIRVSGIPVTRKYIYRAGFRNRVGVMLEFENSAEACEGLGIPLPRGPFRMYQRDADEEAEFIGQDTIGHTPKNEKVSLRLGYAFDLEAERTQLARQRNAGERVELQSWRLRLRNHKDTPVSVAVEELLDGNRNWELLTIDQKWVKHDYRTFHVNLDIPANAESVLNYTVRYTW